MIVALTTSRKARGVIKTSVDLARQDAGDEMFGSSGLARSIVRASSSLAIGIENVMPQGLKRWLGKRFDKDEAILENGAAFDMVRAAVNLLLASLLIALGTSLKLPLSTTYVAFMVAMGSSLADRAWGRESAVFRITGVLSRYRRLVHHCRSSVHHLFLRSTDYPFRRYGCHPGTDWSGSLHADS